MVVFICFEPQLVFPIGWSLYLFQKRTCENKWQVFTGQMPFLLPNQQSQSTERNSWTSFCYGKKMLSFGVPAGPAKFWKVLIFYPHIWVGTLYLFIKGLQLLFTLCCRHSSAAGASERDAAHRTYTQADINWCCTQGQHCKACPLEGDWSVTL